MFFTSGDREGKDVDQAQDVIQTIEHSVPAAVCQSELMGMQAEHSGADQVAHVIQQQDVTRIQDVRDQNYETPTESIHLLEYNRCPEQFFVVLVQGPALERCRSALSEPSFLDFGCRLCNADVLNDRNRHDRYERNGGAAHRLVCARAAVATAFAKDEPGNSFRCRLASYNRIGSTDLYSTGLTKHIPAQN